MCGGSSSCSPCCLTADPCYQRLCCTTRTPVSNRPFVPSYDRCCEDTKMGQLLGNDYGRRWFCERNVYFCQEYGCCGGRGC